MMFSSTVSSQLLPKLYENVPHEKMVKSRQEDDPWLNAHFCSNLASVPQNFRDKVHLLKSEQLEDILRY